MSFLDTTAGKIVGGPIGMAYNALRPNGSQQGYAPLPFDYGENNTVDNARIAQALQQGLGRAPTQNEIEQYAKYIKTGDLTYADIGQISQSMPEADRARLEANLGRFGDVLNAQNDAILGQAAARANSQFSSMGRPVTSAQTASVLQAGGQLAQARQAALADFYGKGLNYNQSIYQSQGQNALARGYQKEDSRTAFNRSLLGYQTQRNDFNTDLANEELRRKTQAWKSLPFTLAGTALGAKFGGPAGAGAGAQIGRDVGGLF